MQPSAFLAEAGSPADELSKKATLAFEQVEGTWTITTIHLDLIGHVSGIGGGKFEQLANDAKAKCPVPACLKQHHAGGETGDHMSER